MVPWQPGISPTAHPGRHVLHHTVRLNTIRLQQHNLNFRTTLPHEYCPALVLIYTKHNSGHALLHNRNLAIPHDVSRSPQSSEGHTDNQLLEKHTCCQLAAQVKVM